VVGRANDPTDVDLAAAARSLGDGDRGVGPPDPRQPARSAMKTSIPFILKATPDPRWGRYEIHSANRQELSDDITELIGRAADNVRQCLRNRP
jgi:hypothetical protein